MKSLRVLTVTPPGMSRTHVTWPCQISPHAYCTVPCPHPVRFEVTNILVSLIKRSLSGANRMLYHTKREETRCDYFLLNESSSFASSAATTQMTRQHHGNTIPIASTHHSREDSESRASHGYRTRPTGSRCRGQPPVSGAARNPCFDARLRR